METKNKASFVGVIVGIVIIIIGFSVMNPETYLLGERDSLGSLIEFGADFYTEIYHMTYQVGHQVQQGYVNICNAIGWLIVCLGAIDICYFLVKTIDVTAPVNGNTSGEEQIVVSNEKPSVKPAVSSPSVKDPEYEGTWRCTSCGKENSHLEVNCQRCGVYR